MKEQERERDAERKRESNIQTSFLVKGMFLIKMRLSIFFSQFFFLFSLPFQSGFNLTWNPRGSILNEKGIPFLT